MRPSWSSEHHAVAVVVGATFGRRRTRALLDQETVAGSDHPEQLDVWITQHLARLLRDERGQARGRDDVMRHAQRRGGRGAWRRQPFRVVATALSDGVLMPRGDVFQASITQVLLC